MPFRNGYENIYDSETLKQLQDILEFVWQTVSDYGQSGSISREEVARLIFAAHARGLTPECIQGSVVGILTPQRLAS